MTTVKAAFKSARVDAVRHMRACERAWLRWGEVGVTEIVTSRAAPAVTVAPFSQPAEAISGADWIWWWVDATAAYGMLVQAKRVTVDGARWHFDFGYPRGSGRQRHQLLSTAQALDLIPVYALYLGTGDYRRWERCPDNHHAQGCLACVKRSVSLMPALLAEEALVTSSSTTYARSIALEDVWTPESAPSWLIPPLAEFSPELLRFLTKPQNGVRAVSRAMIDRVLRVRAGQFAGFSISANTVLDNSHEGLGPVFPNLPDDRGHWGIPYFEQVLNPLRVAPPGYVLELLAEDVVDTNAMASTMPENVAGVVVVQLPGNP
ncbi:hypothetical protein [Mycolicibacterium sp. HS_4_1]